MAFLWGLRFNQITAFDGNSLISLKRPGSSLHLGYLKTFYCFVNPLQKRLSVSLPLALFLVCNVMYNSIVLCQGHASNHDKILRARVVTWSIPTVLRFLASQAFHRHHHPHSSPLTTLHHHSDFKGTTTNMSIPVLLRVPHGHSGNSTSILNYWRTLVMT